MLPPISPEVLVNNPQFASLYSQLETKLLNPQDGSSRSVSTKADDELEQDLRTYRAELAKSRILLKTIRSLTSHKTGLPEAVSLKVQDIIDLVVTFTLHPTSLSKSHPQLLTEDLEDFNDALPIIGQALSTTLTSQAQTLATLASLNLEEGSDTKSINPRNLESKIELLPASIAHRKQVLFEKREVLNTKRIELTDVFVTILDTYRQVLEKAIRLIEDVKFSAVEKSIRSQALCLFLVVENIEGKLKTMKYEALNAIYTPQAVNALDNYQLHLHDTKTRLQARQRTVEEELKRYDRAGSDIKALVGRYSKAMRDIEVISDEIRKLGE